MTRDSPCIAICTTSQGDDVCKGCGRTFEEVTNWLSLTAEVVPYYFSEGTQGKIDNRD